MQRPLPEVGLEPLEEPLGVTARALRYEHAEAPASDPARQIPLPAGDAEPGCDLGEDGVRREVPDLCVQGREPVDVEHDERERLVRAPGPPDLAVEQRVEGLPVVELGQRSVSGTGSASRSASVPSRAGRVSATTFSSDVMSGSLNRRSGERVRTASIPGSLGDSSSGTARP